MGVSQRVWSPSSRRKVWKYRQQTFWAERGLCHVIDERDGDYKSVSVRDFLLRARGFNRGAKRIKHADERFEMVQMVEAMIECAREAQRQGDPCDSRALGEMVSRTKVGQVLMPSQATAPVAVKPLILPSR